MRSNDKKLFCIIIFILAAILGVLIALTFVMPDETVNSSEAISKDTFDNHSNDISQEFPQVSEPIEYSVEESTDEPSEAVSDTTVEPDESEIVKRYTMIISEVMEDSTMYFNNGDSSGWIELFNFGDKAVDLAELCVTGGGKYDENCTLQGRIEAKEYFVIYFDKMPCNITKGKDVSIYHKSNIKITSVFIPGELKKDYSYALRATNADSEEYYITSLATPGYTNNTDGREAYVASEKAGPLVIYELMSSNPSYLEFKGENYDWIEIKNISSSTVSLSDFRLSNNSKKLSEFVFPNKQLKPSESIVVYCSGKPALGANHASFKISSDAERLYLSDKNGKICDCVLVERIPVGGSMGRIDGKKGFFYFAAPTPNEQNANGYRCVALVPKASVEPGVYADKTLTVKLTGDGKIFYTIDGSKPTIQSKLYTEPIIVDKPTVIRAISVADGMLNSAIYTAPYITGTSHDLPVVSVAIEPDDMWSAEKGIYYGEDGDTNANYWKKWEREVNLSIFSKETGNASIDCGIKLSGDGSRELAKKSFQFRFRSKYGKGDFEYDIFADGKYTSFDAIKLRAGEDYPYSLFRDELITAMAGDMTTVSIQDYRYCVLYINGEYFGIYCFRDKVDEDYVAYIENTDKSSIQLMGYNGDAEYGSSSDYQALIKYAKSNDLSKNENFEYIKERVDLDSLIDWFANQVYTSNRDLANDRCYKVDGGKWKWVLYDTDWGFYHHDGSYFLVNTTRYVGTGDLLRALFKNKTFCDMYIKRFAYLLKNVYTYENVCKYCDIFVSILENEMPENCKKWGGSVEKWQSHVKSIKAFTETRYDELVKQTKDFFKLTDSEVTKYFG